MCNASTHGICLSGLDHKKTTTNSCQLSAPKNALFYIAGYSAINAFQHHGGFPICLVPVEKYNLCRGPLNQNDQRVTGLRNRHSTGFFIAGLITLRTGYKSRVGAIDFSKEWVGLVRTAVKLSNISPHSDWSKKESKIVFSKISYKENV